MAVLPPDPVYVLRSTDMEPIMSLCFYGTETLLAGSVKGTIHVWDLQTNRLKLNFEQGVRPITTLCHSEKYLISQEKGGLIKFWLLTNTKYELKSTFECDHSAFCRIDLIPETNTLIFPKGENEICLFSLENFEIEKKLVDSNLKLGHISSLKACKINGEYYILAGYESGDLLTWDLKTCRIINQITYNEVPMTIDYDDEMKRGICGGPSNKIYVFSNSFKFPDLKKKSEIILKNSGINCLKIRQDKKVFTSVGWDGRIRIFSWKSLRPLAVLAEHKCDSNGSVMDICYSPGIVSLWKTPIMAVGGLDRKITLWDLYN